MNLRHLIMTILSSHNPTNIPVAAFYPDVCQACRRMPATAIQGFLCTHCINDIRYIESPICEKCGEPFPGKTARFTCGNCVHQQNNFDWARSSTLCVTLMRDVVHEYKFMCATWFEPMLIRAFLLQAVPALIDGDWDGVVSIPLHPVKIRERGFNQSDHLAASLAAKLRIPFMYNVLSRVKFTVSQSTLARVERFKNMKGVFQANTNGVLSGKRLILVDDVMTTGATVSACAGVLKKAGVLEVAVWTLARGGIAADLA